MQVARLSVLRAPNRIIQGCLVCCNG